MPSSFENAGPDAGDKPLATGALWLQSFRPARTRINARERWRIVAGAFLGILLTGVVCHLAGGAAAASLPWLVAPLGASAVLVFAMPASPLAQPWAVVGGNTLSALVGMAYNNAARRPYPHRQLPVAAEPDGRSQARAADADLDAVLARYNQVLDISRGDLQALLEQTKWQAYQRKLAGVRCADIMSRDLVTATHSTPLEQAWACCESAASRPCRWLTPTFALWASSRCRLHARGRT